MVRSLTKDYNERSRKIKNASAYKAIPAITSSTYSVEEQKVGKDFQLSDILSEGRTPEGMEITGILITKSLEVSPKHFMMTPEARMENDLAPKSPPSKYLLTPDLRCERQASEGLRIRTNCSPSSNSRSHKRRRPATGLKSPTKTNNPLITPTFNNKAIRVLKVKEDKLRNAIIGNIQDSLIQNLRPQSESRPQSSKVKSPLLPSSNTSF